MGFPSDNPKIAVGGTETSNKAPSVALLAPIVHDRSKTANKTQGKVDSETWSRATEFIRSAFVKQRCSRLLGRTLQPPAPELHSFKSGRTLWVL